MVEDVGLNTSNKCDDVEGGPAGPYAVSATGEFNGGKTTDAASRYGAQPGHASTRRNLVKDAAINRETSNAL